MDIIDFNNNNNSNTNLNNENNKLYYHLLFAKSRRRLRFEADLSSENKSSSRSCSEP